MTAPPYQLLPPLDPAAYAALRDDIAASGIRVPVDVDEHGAVLDGHYRVRIGVELGIEVPMRVVAGLTEDEKRAHAVAVEAVGRRLSRSQRRALVVAELERDASRSDRAIARVCGCDPGSVGSARGRRGVPQAGADGEGRTS